MNCKPLQLAQVVRNTTGQHCRAGLIGGTIVQVRELVDHVFDGPSWLYLGQPVRCPLYGVNCPTMRTIPDADLQPFPDPGDEREDEISKVKPTVIEFVDGIAHA